MNIHLKYKNEKKKETLGVSENEKGTESKRTSDVS